MHFRKSIFLLFLIGSCVFLCSMFMPQARASVQQQQGMDSLPLEARYAVSAAMGQDSPGYQVRQQSSSLAADNKGLGMEFSAAGVTVGTGNQKITLRPVQWGYGDELALLPEGAPQAIGNMVTSSRGSVSEWYVNGPLGLQQGFTVTEKPQAGSGPLKISLALSGAKAGSIDADGKGVMLTKADGSPLYRYSGLVVRDAEGRQAEAWLEAKADTLSICVADAGHAYPLYIDPIIQSAKLTASDGAANDNFGISVAISGDMLVVGAYSDDIGAKTDQGSAYVFVKPAGGWANMTQAAKLTASDGAAWDCFGYSVAISADTVVVGAYADDIGSNINQGSAYVFEKPAGGWADMTQTAKLTASGGAQGDNFGYSVAISADTVVVGKYQNSAYVFVKPAGGWANMTQTARLTASDGDASDNFSTVAISGVTVVVGAHADDIGAKTDQGSAYVFVKPSGGWADMTQTAKLTAADGAANDNFGISVAISGDTVVVGARNDGIGANAYQGSAYVFEKPASGWANMTQTAKLTASDGTSWDKFGISVAISGDTVVVGAYQNEIGIKNEQGSAYVFTMPVSGWADMTQTAKLIAQDGAASDYFGHFVAISGDIVVVGANGVDIGTNADQGSASVFVKPAAGWIEPTTTTTSVVPTTTTTSIRQVPRLTASDGAANDSFGTVDISGDTVVVGAPGDDIGENADQGSAYVFVKPAGGWADMTQIARLTASDGGANGRFGSSVAVSGDTVVVTGGGAAYVFVKPAGGWADMTQTARLTCSPYYSLGSVAISGDTVAAIGDGAAYVFAKPAGGWADMSQTAKLTGFALDGDYVNGFSSVAISGDTVVAGASSYYLSWCELASTGAVYVFDKPVAGWSDRALGPSLMGPCYVLGEFGFSVAISGDTMVVGNPGYNRAFGQARIFIRAAGGTWTGAGTLTEPNGGESQYFGSRVAISGSTVVVESNSGIYEFSSAQPTKLIAADPAIGFFLSSFSISQGIVVVGVSGEDIGGNANQGSAYVFTVTENPTTTTTSVAPTTSTTTSVVPTTTTTVAGSDADADGVADASDNCPDAYNPLQRDADTDGTGDVCDTTPGCGGCGGAACESYADTDADGVPDAVDNCPNACNAGQSDADDDGAGDVCDGAPGCGGCGQAACETVCTP